MDSERPHASPSEHRHELKPIDQGYQLIVRTVLWLIAGAVLLALILWWVLT
jgi:hypothetical protein